MTLNFEDLISVATDLVYRIDLGNGSAAGTVAAALETSSGQVHTGVCVDLACGLGVCAEHSAIVEMLKHRETKISQIVAVSGERVLPPCGRCRDMMLQVSPSNVDTRVILSESETVLLKELLPHYWLDQS